MDGHLNPARVTRSDADSRKPEKRGARFEKEF